MGYMENGEMKVVDAYASGFTAPDQDTKVGGKNDILDFGGSVVGATRHVKWIRKLDTGDVKDRAIKLGTATQVIVAFNPSTDNWEYHGNTRLQTTITFSRDFSPDVIPANFENKVEALGGKYTLYWNIISNDIFDAGIIVKGKGWVSFFFSSISLNTHIKHSFEKVGFGISEGTMTKADIIFATQVNGKFQIDDRWAFDTSDTKATGNPTQPDVGLGGVDNILKAAAKRENGETFVRFQRKLVTKDQFDHDITNSTQNVIFAFNPDTDEFQYHGRTAEQRSINLVQGQINKTTHSTLLPRVHGVMMVIGWTFLILFGMSIARYVPKRLEWWFPAHVTLQTLGACFITAAFIIILYYTRSINGDYLFFADKLTGVHQLIGYITTGILFFQIVIGIISDRLWRKKFNATKKIPDASIVDKLHWWIGRLGLILSVINIYLAFKFYNVSKVLIAVFSVWVGIVIVATIIMEIRKCRNGDDGHQAPVEENSSEYELMDSPTNSKTW